ncbi:type IV pilus assembly protein PilB [Stigmatella aurantiaca]|uniref:Type IV pilus assembly protein PilB n=1 Tax=Stigmatella aurantiaca TaxID=41 RepID=A0A1H7R2R4_STIAU|nr:ATPase [Stigmatella aurantiaca]SEL53847.1 type IV pilus assembly protein PilB [Stigmatella aurantiaca]
MRKKRLGDLLQAVGLVDELQLRAALGFHHKWGTPLGQVVVDLGFCTAQQVLEVLADQAQLPAVDLEAEPLDSQLIEVLPVWAAENYRVIPLRQEGPRDSVLVVATAAPGHPDTLDEVARLTGKTRVVSLLATDAAIAQAIERLYYPHLDGAHRPVEPIPLPEADEALPLVTERAECLMLDGLLRRRDSAYTFKNGLPVMKPLTEELPVAARITEREVPVVTRVLTPAKPAEPEVWVYGWGRQATQGLMELLEHAGVRAQVARTEDVRKASAHTVVLAPVQSVESVKRRGVQARLLLAGRSREVDRAWALGAQEYLSGPLRADCLIDAVHEQLRAGRESLRQVG